VLYIVSVRICPKSFKNGSREKAAAAAAGVASAEKADRQSDAPTHHPVRGVGWEFCAFRRSINLSYIIWTAYLNTFLLSNVNKRYQNI
jgi:hypothetical protein